MCSINLYRFLDLKWGASYNSLEILLLILLAYSQLVSDTGLGRGMGCDEAPILKISKDSGNPACRTIIEAVEMKWNEINEMSVEKWWNEICGRGNQEKPR